MLVQRDDNGMGFLIIIVISVLIIGLLVPQKEYNKTSLPFGVNLSIIILTILVGGSPILSIALGYAFGDAAIKPSMFRYMWVGLSISLPVSLAFAKFTLKDGLREYWHYVERFGFSRKTIINLWLVLIILSFAFFLKDRFFI
jgi:hypothetical protein